LSLAVVVVVVVVVVSAVVVVVFLISIAVGTLATHRPHPFGKGRGGCSSSLASEGAVTVSIEPTSLDRGEGLTRRGRQSRLEGERAMVKVVGGGGR
jgi:hypothetical protein